MYEYAGNAPLVRADASGLDDCVPPNCGYMDPDGGGRGGRGGGDGDLGDSGGGDSGGGGGSSCKSFCDDPKRIKEIENRVLFADKKGGRCKININCTANPGASGGYTDPSIRSQPGSNLWEITISINSRMDRASQDSAIAHEMVHARQFCTNQGGMRDMKQCKEMETSAYAASCRLAFPGDLKKQGKCHSCGIFFGCKKFNNGSSQDVKDPGGPKGCEDADVGITME